MSRDIRDPEKIGEAIISAHQQSPSEPVTNIADRWLAPGTAHQNYDESRNEFESRLHGGADPRRNGQLAMFRN